MEEKRPSYREAFPLWCDVDILDAHDYREEIMQFAEARICGYLYSRQL